MTNSTSPLDKLSAVGVSIWLDDLSRERIASGGLQKLIDESNVVGVTTNPTIFATALAKGNAYDAQVAELAAAGTSVTDAVFEITTRRRRGRVRHLPPGLRRDERQSTAASRSRSSRASPTTPPAPSRRRKQLWAKVDRPNVMIKIPATMEGLEAITEATAAGISVNVTLIFSLERHREVIDAYLDRPRAGQGRGHRPLDHPLGRLVLRVARRHRDRQAPRRHRHRRGARAQEQGRRRQRAARLPGVRAGVRDRARARRCSRPAPTSSARCGPRPASRTRLPDTLYVTELAVAERRQHDAREDARGDLRPRRHPRATPSPAPTPTRTRCSTQLAAVGVAYDEVTALLEKEGVEKFIVSWNELLDTVTAALEPRCEAAEVSFDIAVSGAAG